MSLETELKLLLDGERPFKTAELFRALGQHKLRRGKRQRMISTYFDTAAHELAARRMALRIRRIGKQRLQTLKLATPGLAGLGNFLEFEGAVRSDAPDISLIHDRDINRTLTRSGVWGRLAPSFRTEFDRVAWLLSFRESTIELAWDRGRIVAGRKSEPINELELELKSGTPADLFAAAEALLETVPFRLGTRTKAERGLSLLRGEKPIPTKASPAPLLPEDNVASAFEKVVKSCLDQMSANEAAILESADKEAIHQLRVALRRFRAILGPFREMIDDGVHAIWAIDLRWAQRQFGPARDLDVFATETAHPMLRHLGREKGLVQLLAAAESAREEARRAAILALSNPRYAFMQLQILANLAGGKWRNRGKESILAMPIKRFAAKLLQQHHKRVRKLGKNWYGLSDPDLHRLRILVKKLRYIVGFFQPLFPGGRAKTYAAALTALQDSLGAVNDAVVGRQLLRDFAPTIEEVTRSGEINPAEMERALGLVAGWQARGIEAQRQALVELWPRFANAKKFWRRPIG